MARKTPLQVAEWRMCTGEAHKSYVAGNIDHCGVCMPYWNTYPVCSKCGRKLEPHKSIHGVGVCRICNIKYDIGQPLVKENDNGESQPEQKTLI